MFAITGELEAQVLREDLQLRFDYTVNLSTVEGGYVFFWDEDQEWTFSPQPWWIVRPVPRLHVYTRPTLSLSNHSEGGYAIGCIFSLWDVITDSLYEEISSAIEPRALSVHPVRLSISEGIAVEHVSQVDFQAASDSFLYAYQWIFSDQDPQTRRSRLRREITQGAEVVSCHVAFEEAHVILSSEAELTILSPNVEQATLPRLISRIYSSFGGRVQIA